MDLGRAGLLGDRYRLHKRLGRGGMATVYAATDARLERPVAVKVFHRPADEVALARLATEATLLARLAHPGLVKVYDVEAGDDAPYLVMQLVPGGTLRTVINRGPLPPAMVARLGVRLADTLAYVHMRQIVHRDIKPSNVLLDREGECYLADFGIAKAVGSARLTATGHCVGTAAYLAPEQVAGVRAGPPADVYALGLVLLECLTGRPEYPGTEVEAALARLTRAPRIPDRVPANLRAALTAMTAREPADRPDAATCARLLGTPVGQTLVLEHPAPRRRLRRWPVAVAAAAVLAGVATGVVLTAGGAAPDAPAAPVPAPVGPGTPTAAVPPRKTADAQVVVAPPERPAPKGKPVKDKHGHGQGSEEHG